MGEREMRLRIVRVCLVLAGLVVAIAGCGPKFGPGFRTTLVPVIVFDRDRHKVKELIDAGADVNATEANGRTALMYAAGIHLSVSDRHLERVARKIVSIEDIDLIRLLLASGANPNAISNYGDTALQSAIYHGRYETAKVLLEKGADPNLAPDGWTPLMLASHHCYGDLIALLLEQGANPSVTNSTGQTSELIARQSQCPESMVILLAEDPAATP